ncbi:MAG: hypothetical protein ACRDTZ_03315 [Pseudonocardiaceae bacterium]
MSPGDVVLAEALRFYEIALSSPGPLTPDALGTLLNEDPDARGAVARLLDARHQVADPSVPCSV